MSERHHMTDFSTFTHDRRRSPVASRQGGMTLVVSLIFLLILTILGVTAMNTSSLQQKMAGNMRDSDMALQAAETGLRGGEGQLNLLYVTGKPVADTSGSSGVWSQGTTNVLLDSWWTANGITYTGSLGYSNPQYVIEEADYVPDSLVLQKGGQQSGTQYYRISSNSVGVSPMSKATLQETYRVRSN